MLLRCASCGCGFFFPPWNADYSREPAGGDAALSFYLQQGAGIWGITSNIADLGRPAGTRFLEVGCGFGFGLDFARRVLGWEVLGLDPSPIAAAGREHLGLPIESRYLVTDDPALSGQFDVVMASEVIEHISSPLDFARTLLSALRGGGALVLTTPDVDAARPDTPPGLLVPLLSIDYHLVLQSADSLAALLREAGFEEVEVRRTGGASLLARAQRPAGRIVSTTEDAQEPRRRYRRYLTEAAAAVEEGGDLWFGLIARAFREAVNAADVHAASAHWAEFSGACHRRYGLDPDAAGRPAPPVNAQSLEDLAALEPLCLGPVLFHRAMHHLLAGKSRTSVEELFERSAEACGRLRAALQRIGTDDGDAEDIIWTARAEAILCAAERGVPEVPGRLTALGPAPEDASRPAGLRERTERYRRRAFVSLVNASALEAAGQLDDVIAATERRAVQDSEPPTSISDDELDVLFCAAARELQLPGGSPAHALDLLQLLQAASTAVRRAGRDAGSAVTLVAPAREAEILALEVLGRADEAKSLRAASTLTGGSGGEPAGPKGH
jgi:SAM-dependent methyltransferase